MVRKVATALLILAVTLLGLQPRTDAMAMAMDMHQPCCDDCDQPAMPQQGGCQTMAGCVTVPPLTMLGATPVPVFFSGDAGQAAFEQPVLASTDTAPPFRPPRF